MHPILAAVGIIRFVGIMMWTDGITTDRGIHVLIPALSGPHNFQHNSNQPVQPVSQPFDRPVALQWGPVVEAHVPMIIYKTENFAGVVGWERKTIADYPGLEYVVLSGDRLRIYGGTNPEVHKLALNLPRPQTLCGALGNLSAGYKPPYRGLAAIVDVPEAKELRACSTKPGFDNGRADTELKLEYTAILTIAAGEMSNHKQLRLKSGKDQSGAQAIIANVPLRALRGDVTPKPESAPDGLRHSVAYYQMGSGDSRNCRAVLKTSTDLKGCDVILGSGVGKNDAGILALQVDFECSNSQWP